MNRNIYVRVLEEAHIIINTEVTLRELSRHLGVSKSTIHKDMNEKLIIIDKELYKKVKKIFKKHLDTRYYIGGEATRKKYQKML